ncbi:hypothetical protein JCGZ_10803 [Jatropha curcas]|uniref:Uncharacterized protein n=1 Tax=Jatropha curcas TaxID=180498 RepID=A0A067KT14_JATCU|nr:hypothetical protein JCGZ_10803 [Jatropha curcas]
MKASNAVGAPPSRPQPEHSTDEISALRACVDDQERQLAEHKAHVMQMSSPQATTTSSNPLIVTDPPEARIVCSTNGG